MALDQSRVDCVLVDLQALWEGSPMGPRLVKEMTEDGHRLTLFGLQEIYVIFLLR